MANEQEARLRDAFAQLLAQGNGQAVPMEAVMAAQGLGQFPQPPASPAYLDNQPILNDADNALLKLDIQRPQGFSGADVRAPTRMIENADPTLNFPTGTPPGQMKDAPPPFPGARSVEVTPYRGGSGITPDRDMPPSGPPPAPKNYDMPPSAPKNYDMPPSPKKKDKKKDKG